VFSTLAEGLKGKRAKEWGLIDGYFPTSKFQESIDARVKQLTATSSTNKESSSIRSQFETLTTREITSTSKLKLNRDQRYADLTVHAPEGPQPQHQMRFTNSALRTGLCKLTASWTMLCFICV
jgi:benzoyl-CoA-dihydrodiol lyase